tara:strand:+ start:1832 stop:2212 length:381 start_codon:yes stop_codon:yes gene_type:complete
MDTKHNGWTNYATWRINLEMIGDQEFHRDEAYIDECKNGDTYKLSLAMQDYVLDSLSSDDSLTYDYACAFVAEVNFYEIAEHIISDYEESHCRNCNEQLDYDTSVGSYCSEDCSKEDEVLSTSAKG